MWHSPTSWVFLWRGCDITDICARLALGWPSAGTWLMLGLRSADARLALGWRLAGARLELAGRRPSAHLVVLLGQGRARI
jgi:hypothetical protein